MLLNDFIDFQLLRFQSVIDATIDSLKNGSISVQKMKILEKGDNKVHFVELEELFLNQNKSLNKILKARTLEIENFRKFYAINKEFYLFLDSLNLTGILFKTIFFSIKTNNNKCLFNSRCNRTEKQY